MQRLPLFIHLSVGPPLAIKPSAKEFNQLFGSKFRCGALSTISTANLVNWPNCNDSVVSFRFISHSNEFQGDGCGDPVFEVRSLLVRNSTC